ncbi:helix-turn-helix transcriptional regulator [Candidatus Latescibacterota bacterium]
MMDDSNKSGKQLIRELQDLREKNARIEEERSKYLEFEKILKKNMYNLRERIKELNCLYGISKLVENYGISSRDLIQRIVDIIPASWQYPNTTCSRITIDYQEFRTKIFRETLWKQECDIFVNGAKCGSIEVFYMEEMPECDEGAFLKEERNLLNAIAERLGRIIERKKADEHIMKIQKELKTKATNLDEMNTALQVLLKHQDKEKKNMEYEILAKLKTLVFPYLKKLYLGVTDEVYKNYTKIIEKNLNEITKSFSDQFIELYTNLTPTEIQVASLVIDNKTTNEIATLMNIGETTVSFHRKNIRIRLGISGKKTNLRSYLQSHMLR